MLPPSLKRARPLGAVSSGGQFVAWLLRLAFTLVISVAVLGTAGASPSADVTEGEGERGEFGEFGEFGEYGELITKLLTKTGQDGSEYDAAQVCATRRVYADGGPRSRTRDGHRVPRVLAPTVVPRETQRPRRPQRTAPADDDDE